MITALRAPADSRDLDEVTGIRLQLDVERLIHWASGPEPSPVYFLLLGRRFFLGVRFPTGIIASLGWETDLRDAGVPECLIAGASRWLEGRAL